MLAGAERDQADATTGLQTAAQRLAAGKRELDALPTSRAKQEFDEAPDTLAGVARAFVRNPVALPLDLTLNSLPGAVPGMAAGALIGSEAGPVGTMAGAAFGSFAPEFAGKFTEAMEQAGANLADPQSIAAFMADDAKVAAARNLALKKGIPIAILDGLTAGVAGRFLGAAAGKGIGKVAIATAKEAGTQMAGGALGETAGELVAGETLSPKSILAEAMAEGPTSIQEGATNIRHERLVQQEGNAMERWGSAIKGTNAAPAEPAQAPAATPQPISTPAPAAKQQGAVGSQPAAGVDSEIDDVLAAERAQVDAQRATADRAAAVQAQQARSLQDLVGDALAPRVSQLETPETTDLQRHDFWQGIQGLAQSLANLQSTTADGQQARSRQLNLPEIQDQARLIFQGAKPEQIDAIAIKLHGNKPAESVAAMRYLYRYAAQQRAPYAPAAQAREAEEQTRRHAAQEETSRIEAQARAEAKRVARERAAIRDTGRDLDGRVADWAAVPEEELDTLAAGPDGAAHEEITGAQAEIERRGREEGQQRPLTREAQLRLIEKYGGINPAHPVHAGEIATIRESGIGRNKKLFHEQGNNLDTLAQQIRQDVINGPQTEADVLEWVGQLAAGQTPKLYERGDMERTQYAAARRAEPLTEGITQKTLETPVPPVQVSAAQWNASNRDNRQRILAQPPAEAVVATDGRKVVIDAKTAEHSFSAANGPEAHAIIAAASDLARQSVWVGTETTDMPHGVAAIHRYVAAANTGTRVIPVRLTIAERTDGRLHLYDVQSLGHKKALNTQKPGREDPVIPSAQRSPTVADLLSDVKPQPDGTFTAAFARGGRHQPATFQPSPKQRQEVGRMEKAFRRIAPALFADFDVKIANVREALRAAGERGRIPANAEGAYKPLGAERHLIVVGMQAALTSHKIGLA
ncbi:MAG: hypothetical protein IPL39_17990 [Opitutaceae bacterium]|nr:hypothetical protein [Opitutaceae bacterium]